MREGNDAAAVPLLERALRSKSDYPSPHYNLARIAYKRGQFDVAEREVREALRLQDDRDNRVLLANVLTAQGKTAEAREMARSAVSLDPSSTSAHDALARALAREGKTREALSEVVAVVRASPEDPEYQSHLAWLLATADDPALRKPKQAIAIAELAVKATDSNDALALDALAISLAADGQFEAASMKATAAVKLASETNPFIASQIERRLAAYKAREMPDALDRILPPSS
jgi:Flp pilus assembly protein TadD